MTAEEERDAIERAFVKRLAVYDSLLDLARMKSNFGALWERPAAIEYVIEAIELLALECGLDPRGDHHQHADRG